LDEDAMRLIELKTNKGDYIEIHPLKVNTNGSVTYQCECRAISKKHHLYQSFVVLTMNQKDVVRECYRLMRKRDKTTECWRHFIRKSLNHVSFLKS
jgi:hypothetical protein